MCRLIIRAAQDRPDRHLRRKGVHSAAAAAADLAVRQVVPAVHSARQVSAAVAAADSAAHQAVPAVHSAAEDPAAALSIDNIKISGFKTV